MSAAVLPRHARLFELVRQENLAEQHTSTKSTEVDPANGPELAEIVRYLNGSLAAKA